MELIDREAVEKITWEEPAFTDALNVLSEVRDKVRELPTVQAVPIEVLYDIQAEVNDLYNEYRSKSAITHPDKNYERISNAVMGTAADTLEMVLEIIYNHMCGVDE